MPDNFYLFVSHAHEDHYAGIYSIPKDKNFNLFVGKITYDIIKAKSRALNLELPKPRKTTFLEDKQEIKIENTTITPIAVKHNIPENYGFIVKNSFNRILYLPDYKEKFWEKVRLEKNDVIITDFVSPLPPQTKGKFERNKITAFLQKYERIFFVDYGWDFETIIDFAKIADVAGKEIRLSPNIFSNFSINDQKFLKEIPFAIKSKGFNPSGASEILICDISEFKISISNYPDKENLGIISNHYSLSNQPRSFLHPFKKECFLNVFEGGHIQGIGLIHHSSFIGHRFYSVDLKRKPF